MEAQVIGISLHNKIGDSAGEFLVIVLWGLIFWNSMYLKCSLSLLFLCQVWGHLCLVEPNWCEFSLSLSVCLNFCIFFFLYAGLSFTVAYTRGFL